MESKYLVSLITPFHNTNMKLFSRGFEELKKNTIGFENIEWVIVIHNSEENYVSDVKSLVAGYDNIKVYVLNNEERTPSSPRNYALDRASGKYIGFMDSDDYLTTDGLKDIVGYMEKTGAEMCSFRATAEREDETVRLVMDMRTRFDQTVDCIDLPKGDERFSDIVTVGGLSLWSKLIRRDHIEKYHTRFNVNIMFGEDVVFSMQCMKNAEHVLILPQTIGYVYYMNHGSLAQNTNISPETAMYLAYNTRDILECAIDCGLRYENLGWACLDNDAQVLAVVPGVTDEMKEEFKSIVQKYFDEMPPLKGDGKFLTTAQAESIMQMARMVLLGEKANGYSISLNTLLSILSSNTDCELGIKYGFRDINSIDKYRNLVPLSDAKSYAPLIKLMRVIGEENIITSAKVTSYSERKSDDGRVEYTPQTVETASEFQKFFVDTLRSNESSTFAIFEIFNELENDADKSFGSDIFNSHSKKYKYGMVTSPKEAVILNERFDGRYVRLLFALADKDITQILAASTYEIYDHFRYLEGHFDDLCNDIEKGTISAGGEIPESVKKAISGQLIASKERADELRKIFAEGFSNIVKKIWPGIKIVYAAGTGGYAVYTRVLKRYLGEIPIDNGYLMTPGAVIGKSVAAGSDEFRLLENKAFFEFLPENSDENTTYTSAEVDINKRYEVIVTNASGLYRYKTGVIVEVCSIAEENVVIKYCYNKIHVINIGDYRMDPIIGAESVLKFEDATEIPIADYRLKADNDTLELTLITDIWDEASEKVNDYSKDELDTFVKEAFGYEKINVKFL